MVGDLEKGFDVSCRQGLFVEVVGVAEFDELVTVFYQFVEEVVVGGGGWEEAFSIGEGASKDRNELFEDLGDVGEVFEVSGVGGEEAEEGEEAAPKLGPVVFQSGTGSAEV